MTNPIHTIMTHPNPHWDELVAIWLCLRFGEEKYPGISQAKIVFAGSGGEKFRGCSSDTLKRRNVLALGVCGGSLDEHPTYEKEKKESECAATLIAKDLGIEKNPVLEKILHHALITDTKPTNPFDISSVAKTITIQNPQEPLKALQWAIVALDSLYEQQRNFLLDAAKEFEEKAEIEEIRSPKGKILKMAVVRSSNPQVNKFARSKYGGRMAIIIQVQPSGNVQIFTDQRQIPNINQIAAKIRIAEQQIKGEPITTNGSELTREGKVRGAEEWYYLPQGGMLLNGSLSNPKVPPTKLPIEKITDIVKTALSGK